MIENRLITGDATRVSLSLEDVGISGRRWRFHSRAISHSPKEGLIGKILFIEICREHDELLERNFDLFSCMQREIVDASLEWNNPAIQKILGRNTLSTKVVND